MDRFKSFSFAFLMFVLAVYLLIACIGKFVGIADKLDIDNAGAAAEQYCKMVYEGHWPDYQKTYDKFCNGPKWNGK